MRLHDNNKFEHKKGIKYFIVEPTLVNLNKSLVLGLKVVWTDPPLFDPFVAPALDVQARKNEFVIADVIVPASWLELNEPTSDTGKAPNQPPWPSPAVSLL